MKKIAIIGGGAAGMFCAITAAAARSDLKITIYEKLPRVGKKLLATGNGRCNITNKQADGINHYHGTDREFAAVALESFSAKDLTAYFEINGLMLKQEGDEYYPNSEQAGTVVDFLRFKCENLGVSTITESAVTKINKKDGGYIVNDAFYDSVVIATGGQASPHLGSDGSGYTLLEGLGHKCSPLLPALTKIKTETEYVKQLKGIKVNADVSLFADEATAATEYGQVLFTEYGLSGPPILQLSRIAAKSLKNDKKCSISLNFMNDYKATALEKIIAATIENPFIKNLTCENLLSLMLNKRLGQVIVKSANVSLNTPADKLSKSDIGKIVYNIQNFPLQVTGVKGFTNAQVTAGGILTKDFCPKTLQSKLHKGLYACGEVLDIDGDCGGFNLQWAFSSGRAVGKSLAEELL